MEGIKDIRLMEKDAQFRELGSLLVSWEDGNISDYEYCNKVGKILGLGKWTCKGYKEGESK